MNRAFKFRYVNEIAGGFVLLGVGLLIAGIYLAGHAQGWFQKKLVLHAAFPPAEGTYGLQEGAEVRILGTLAGRVGEILPSAEGGMETSFVIKRKFRNFVREDSIAKVRKKFEVFGDAYVEITLGDAKQPIMKSGAYIKCVQDVELIQTARKMLDDFRAAAVPMLDEFRGILSHVNGVTRQLEEKEGAAGRLIGDKEWAREIEGIVKDIRQTSAQLPAMAAKLDAAMNDFNAAMSEFKKMSGTLNTTAGRFPAVTEDAAGVVRDVREFSDGLTGQVANVEGVLVRAQTTLRETQRLIEGLQKHWLVRKYIEQPETTEMISPAQLPPKGESR